MKRIYLDTCHWIGLSEALDGKEGPYREALDLIDYAVAHSLASFPVSSIHYIEINTKADPTPRRRAGAAIAAISKHHTIANLATVLTAELDAALASLLDLSPPPPLQVFGVGHAHAFGQPERKLKLAAAADQLPPGQRVQYEKVARDFLEMNLIGGPPFRLPANGIAAPDRSYGEKFAADAQLLSDRLADWGRTDDHAEKLAIVSEYQDMTDLLNERLVVNGADPQTFVSMGGDFLRDFLEQLPVRWTGCQLRRVAFRSNRKWKPNDMNDIGALSLAAVHCDVVVFEKHWADTYRQTNLQQKATVLSSIEDLAVALV